MDISLFDYDLPKELIAQYPSRRRDQSRLMILDRATDSIDVVPFRRIVDYLDAGDLLVVNNTKVFKARLFGRRKTGARVEVFLIRSVRERHKDSSPETPINSAPLWEAFVSPSRRVNEKEHIHFSENHKVTLERDIGGGRWLVRFRSRNQQECIVQQFGHVPLPHYIKREDRPEDIRRYQTVFASKDKVGAVAAPTAGFHFTRPILNKLEQRGVKRAEVTLHVGPGTFKPVKVNRVENHTVDPELAELSPEAAGRINTARRNNGRVNAVGTTTMRTLESAPTTEGGIRPFSGMVDLYIRPGFKFRFVDRLLTNFHLPKSSLLILVSAFAGREFILEAYRAAINQRMRFYSYGDAMLIL